jgi:putative DNA primase/helicase
MGTRPEVEEVLAKWRHAVSRKLVIRVRTTDGRVRTAEADDGAGSWTSRTPWRWRPEDAASEESFMDWARDEETEAFRLQPEDEPLFGGGLAYTDLGNAGRFMLRYAKWVRHVTAWRKVDPWLLWDGRRWVRDRTSAVEQMSRETVQEMMKQVDAMPGGTEGERKLRAEAFTWAYRSQSKVRIDAMLGLAARELAVDAAALDADTSVINLQDGVLDLNTGRLIEHDPARLITRLSLFRWGDGDADCPRWKAALDRWFGGDREMISFVQRIVGMTLAAEGGRNKGFFVALGPTNGGKTAFQRALAVPFGDYAMTTRPDAYAPKREDSIPHQVANFSGARLILASEPDSRMKLSEALVKQLTGGEGRIRASRKYENEIEFEPLATHIVATNHEITIGDQDDAIWNRVKVLLFPHSIPDEEQVDMAEFLLDLTEELCGILLWALDGLSEFRAVGLAEPARMVQAREAWREAEDELLPFIEAFVEEADGEFLRIGDLYTLYEPWATGNGYVGLRLLTRESFGKVLTQRWGAEARTRRGPNRDRGYIGYRLKRLRAGVGGMVDRAQS